MYVNALASQSKTSVQQCLKEHFLLGLLKQPKYLLHIIAPSYGIVIVFNHDTENLFDCLTFKEFGFAMSPFF